MAKQEQRREKTRALIVEAATTLFGRDGFDGTTIDDIAAQAGVAKGAVYHHFSNKRAIFESVFEWVSVSVVQYVRESVSGEPDILKSLIVGTRAYLMQCAIPEKGRILLQDGPAVLGWAEWRAADAHHFGGMVAKSLSIAMEKGVIRQQPVEELSQLILGAIQSAAFDCASQDNFEQATETYMGLMELLIGGLK